MRLLRDVGGVVSLAETTGAAPTVTATRDSDGSVAATGTATGTDGEWVFGVTAAQVPDVELLNVEWASGSSTWRTQAEVVGGFLCTLDEIRDALDGGDFTDDALEDAREWAEDWLEKACRVAFRPRYCREKLSGQGTDLLFLSNPLASSVLSASDTGTTITPSSIDVDPVGVLNYSSWSEGTRNVSVAYIHGHDSTPALVRTACIRLARYRLLEDPSNTFERATSYTTEDATYTLITPGVRGAFTPIPEVNSVIQQYRYVLSV